jgi:hypothetical protein
MTESRIPILTVSYNTPQLLSDLLASIRRFYDNPIHIVDGSDAGQVAELRAIVARHADVHLHVQGFNIHHGPGLTWAFQHLDLGRQVLVVDSDVVFLGPGLIETLQAELRPEAYGVGAVSWVNRSGVNVQPGAGAIPYLHPAMMLCNLDVLGRWPMPIKHGAPMIEAMAALHEAGQSGLLQHLDWVAGDLGRGGEKRYFDHLWQGTVKRTGGYHLEEWMARERAQAQKQQEAAELLRYLPASARKAVLISENAALLEPLLAQLRPDLECLTLKWGSGAAGTDGLESAGAPLPEGLAGRDCWILDGALARFKDPWGVLARLRELLPPGGALVVRMPNAQHWRIQGALAVGDFRYGGANPILDRAHLHGFTRVTLFELFQAAGFRMDAGAPQVAAEAPPEPVMQAIRQLAAAMGRDPEGAARDALPHGFVVRLLRADA